MNSDPIDNYLEIKLHDTIIDLPTLNITALVMQKCVPYKSTNCNSANILVQFHRSISRDIKWCAQKRNLGRNVKFDQTYPPKQADSGVADSNSKMAALGYGLPALGLRLPVAKGDLAYVRMAL